jgi:hypothetical protein
MTRAKTVAASNLNAFINGIHVGQVTGWSWSSSENRREYYGLDSSQPQELIPTVTRVAGQLQLIRTIGDGGVEAMGVAATLEQYVRERYFQLLLVERGTDSVVFQADNCSLLNQSWSVQARGILTGQIDFVAQSWSNETSPL